MPQPDTAMQPNTAIETNTVQTEEADDLRHSQDKTWWYSRPKIAASLQEFSDFNRKQAKSMKGSVSGVKKEDIEYIVNAFDISQALAEKALSENGGNLDGALRALVAS